VIYTFLALLIPTTTADRELLYWIDKWRDEYSIPLITFRCKGGLSIEFMDNLETLRTCKLMA
jgi:hypothetical protein